MAGDIVVTVPVPSLIVLIGAAGSGKTTLGARLFGPDEVISSDELRAVVSGDAADQRATRPAFAILHRELGSRLAAGRLVVVDATSVEEPARRALLRGARAARVAATALVVALPGDLVHSRNESRTDRPVPAEVVERHLARVAGLVAGGDTAAIEKLGREGFATVVILRSDDEIARLRIVRVPAVSRR
jgi:protein phosphatase